MKSGTKKAPVQAGLKEAFVGLRQLLAEHVPPLRVLVDKPNDFQVVSATRQWRGRPLWIGAVQIKKNYTSFHFLPVYAMPELLSQASPELKKRKQGKGCFNFKAADRGLFAELKGLCDAGIPKFDSDSLLAHVEKERAKAKKKRAAK
jgi:hypothetical protein